MTATADVPFTITVNGTEVENGKSVSWQAGENILEIAVAEGLTYTVTVMKQ